MVVTLGQFGELLEVMDLLDALMPPKFQMKDRKGSRYFKAQVIDLNLILQTSDIQMLQAGQRITPLGTRAYLMNMLPAASGGKAFPANVTLNHGYDAANYYPDVPLDMLDDRGIYVDFSASETEYSQIRQVISSSPMGAFDMPVELSEIVMPRVRSKKVVHFQPMWIIFMSSDVPKHFFFTPWLALMRADPFQNPDELSRNWLCFYRMYNSMTKFSGNFSVVDPVAHHKFMLEKRSSPTYFRVEDWRRLDTPLTDEQLILVVSLVNVNPHEKGRKANMFEKLVMDAMGHKAAEFRFDPPNLDNDRSLVFGFVRGRRG